MSLSQPQLEAELAASLQVRCGYYAASLQTVAQIRQALEQEQDDSELFRALDESTRRAAAEEKRSQHWDAEFKRRRVKAGPALQVELDRTESTLAALVKEIGSLHDWASQHRDALQPQIKTQAKAAQMRSAYASASRYASDT